MVPGQERGPLLGQSISTGQASVKQHPASEGVLVWYGNGGGIAIVDRSAEHWLEEHEVRVLPRNQTTEAESLVAREQVADYDQSGFSPRTRNRSYCACRVFPRAPRSHAALDELLPIFAGACRGSQRQRLLSAGIQPRL